MALGSAEIKAQTLADTPSEFAGCGHPRGKAAHQGLSKAGQIGAQTIPKGVTVIDRSWPSIRLWQKNAVQPLPAGG
jgi:hypothetical protein